MTIEREAARPKRAEVDAPSKVTMKDGLKIRRAPSTDQKRVRREMARKTATQFSQTVENLQPGDQIRTPTGQSVQVQRVRNHETSMGHYYVDTNAGTTLVGKGTNFTVMPRNNVQQEVPGFGIPGANSNSQPWSGQGGSPSNNITSKSCPNCGRDDTMHRVGDHFVCSHCGYQEKVGPLGEHSLLDIPQQIRDFQQKGGSLSAVAARAHEYVVNTEENQ